MKKSLPLSQVYKLLEPGPVVMVSTVYKNKTNVMPMSWHTMMEFEPPLIGCVISNRDYSFNALKKNKECVINIPTVELANTMVACGKISGEKIDKIKKFNLTTKKAACVNAPLIDDCYANLECIVVDTKLVDKYNFFILEVVKAWLDPSKKQPKTLHHRGRGLFIVAEKTIKLPFGK